MTNEIEASDARDEASRYGKVCGTGSSRHDGGWDFVVETDDGDTIVSVVRDQETGLICSASF